MKGPFDALVFFAVARVGAGQAAQRHRSRHEAEVGVRFAGPDKLVHLIGKGEAAPRLGRGVADRRHVIQAGDGITDRNQPAALTMHALFSHVPQTTPFGGETNRHLSGRRSGASFPSLPAGINTDDSDPLGPDRGTVHRAATRDQ